jgi:hypothetical protein
MTPRCGIICPTCKLHFYGSESLRENRRSAQRCIDREHPIYASGIGRLDLPTVRTYTAGELGEMQPTLF